MMTEQIRGGGEAAEGIEPSAPGSLILRGLRSIPWATPVREVRRRPKLWDLGLGRGPEQGWFRNPTEDVAGLGVGGLIGVMEVVIIIATNFVVNGDGCGHRHIGLGDRCHVTREWFGFAGVMFGPMGSWVWSASEAVEQSND
jgi:hypothetical protein